MQVSATRSPPLGQAVTLDDRFAGLMVGSVVGDGFGKGRGRLAAMSAAHAILSAPSDERVFGMFRVKYGNPAGRFGRHDTRFARRPDGPSIVAAAVAGACHWRNPWLRYRFAAACAPLPVDAATFSVAVACQAAALAAASAMVLVPGRSPEPSASRASEEMGWHATVARPGIPKPAFNDGTIDASDRWDQLAGLIDGSSSAAWASGIGDTVREALSARIHYGDAPAAIWAWRRTPFDVRQAMVGASSASVSSVGPAVAGMLAGATSGESGMPGFAVEESRARASDLSRARCLGMDLNEMFTSRESIF